MNNYKFTKPNNPRSFIQQYANDTDAQTFADSYDGGGWNVENLGPVPQKSASELLASDIEFLKGLMADFILLNRADNITPIESQILLTEFNGIKQLSEVGAVPEVRASIEAIIPPVARVYTVERKANDLAKIDAYMSIR